MDLGALTALLTPFLPMLLKAGDAAAEEAAKTLGADAWKYAKAIWDKLRLKVETIPAAQDAALDAAEVPDDPDAVAAFRHQLKKLLTNDEALAREVGLLLDEAKVGNVTITASGERSVAGQNITDTVIITGDQ
jgi:hypothetical protein